MRTRTAVAALSAGLALSSAAFAAPSLDAPSSIPVAQRPAGVASADFNGDGIADLAVVADTIDRIDVFFGNGDGSFGAAMPIFTGGGSGPDGLAAADVNGDGQQDLVVVLDNISQVRAYINAGGFFSAGASSATGQNPVSIAAADLDNDGDVDFVTANRDSNSFTVITNTGGVFSSADFAAGDEPRYAAPIDLAGDGVPEIAVSNSRDRAIAIHGGAGYAVQQVISVGGVVRPEGLAVADLDNDGDLDLAAALSDDLFSRAGTYMNTGGVLGAQVAVPTNGANSSQILAADLDMDGDADLVVTNQDSGSISIIENTGGVFGAGVAVAAGTRPSHMASADFDGNGSPDLAVSNRDSNNTLIYLNAAAGACNAADLAEPFGQLTFADINAFLAAFNAQDAAADLAAPLGSWTFADITAYLGAFAAGCP
jgi:hypothetical protein